MEWIIVTLISVISLSLAAVKSTWLVDYAVLVFVFNREIRRVIDYYINHDFNPLSPISLTPLILAATMAARWVIDFSRLPNWASRIFICLIAAIAYAFAIGFLNVQFGAVYALGEVLGPLALFGYVMVLNPPLWVRDRWVRSFSWGAIFASLYGWYQYLTIPPWDAFWLKKAGLIGYMGIPEPTKMTVFSTMAERGPLAAFLGLAVVPMIASSRWRTFLSWPAVVLVFSCILLTGSRGGLMMALIGTAVFILVNRGANWGQILVGCMIVGFAAWFGIGQLPGSDRILKRLGSLEEIQEDSSYKVRVNNMSGGMTAVLANPFGAGLGSAGLGTRVNTGGMQTTTTFGDAGYFQIVLVYGVIGTVLFLLGLRLIWRRLNLYFNVPELRNEHVMLARALMIAMIPACWLGDMLTGLSIFWLSLGCGIALRSQPIERLEEEPEESEIVPQLP